MNQLPNARFPFRSADLAIEVLADHHVGRQLAPTGGNLAVGLLEQGLAVIALDRGRPQFPLDRLERVGNVGGTEDRLDRQAFWVLVLATLLHLIATIGHFPQIITNTCF